MLKDLEEFFPRRISLAAVFTLFRILISRASSGRKAVSANSYSGLIIPNLQKIFSYFEFSFKAKINAILTDKISEVLWTKYLLMCPIGSLTSMTGRTYGGIWEDVLLRKKAKDMMMEVVAVAKSQNIHLSSDAVDKAMEMIASFGYHSKTSMQLDFEKGRPTEMDTLTAYLCQVGKESGVPTPLHDEVYTTLKLKHIVRN